MTSAELSGPNSSAAAAGRLTSPWLLTIYFLTILTPLYFSLGPLRIDPPRAFLLAMFVPFLVQLFSGRAGRVGLPDVMMMLYAFWIIVALTFHHGGQGLENGGITVAELLGGWMAGRLLIRTPADYHRLVRLFIVALVVLMPFAVISLATGRNLPLEFFRMLGDAPAIYQQRRWEVVRTQLVFPHPILLGLFCSLAIANFYYLVRYWFLLSVLVVGMAFSSLSSAPLLAVAFQGGMIAWDKVFHGRWALLLAISASGYVILDLLSNRTPLVILIETLTFSAGTGWTRIHIWNYGSAAVLANPILGIGHNMWPKPSWLTDSVDNFWLLNAMRYGLVGGGFLIAGLVVHIVKVVRARDLTPEAAQIRTAYMITVAGTIMTLATVHIWGGISTFIMFFFGAGSFLYTSPSVTGGGAEASAAAEPEASCQPPRLRRAGLAAAAHAMPRPATPARTSLTTEARRAAAPSVRSSSLGRTNASEVQYKPDGAERLPTSRFPSGPVRGRRKPGAKS